MRIQYCIDNIAALDHCCCCPYLQLSTWTISWSFLYPLLFRLYFFLIPWMKPKMIVVVNPLNKKALQRCSTNSYSGNLKKVSRKRWLWMNSEGLYFYEDRTLFFFKTFFWNFQINFSLQFFFLNVWQGSEYVSE